MTGTVEAGQRLYEAYEAWNSCPPGCRRSGLWEPMRAAAIAAGYVRPRQVYRQHMLQWIGTTLADASTGRCMTPKTPDKAALG